MWISEDRLNELLQLSEDRALSKAKAELYSAIDFHGIDGMNARVTKNLKSCDEFYQILVEKWSVLYDRVSDLESSFNRSDKKRLEFESEILDRHLLFAQELQQMRENFESIDGQPLQNLGELTVKSNNIVEFDALINTVKAQASQGRKATVSVVIQPEPARLAIKKKGGK